MTVVKISTQPRSYEALIECGVLERAGEILQGLVGERRKLFVITATPVRRKWGQRLMKSLRSAGFRAQIVEMPDGERQKRLSSLERLADQLTKLKAERDSLLIALGGGVVGDVAGFLASIYMRGVDVVQIPTTVLAQVDASIGGKTGVNLRGGKNLLGTFHQPLAVLIDPTVLSTLRDRQFRAGLYEALKSGVIGNPALFARLEGAELKKLRRDAAELEWIIGESVRLKAEVVSADEREGGLRRVLNFGHTVGHALEADMEYRHFLHGEAVAWGMIAATKIAQSLGLCDRTAADRIVAAVFNLGRLPSFKSRTASILRLMQSDKKVKDGALHFVLPREIGQVEIVKNVPAEVVVNAVNELRRMSQ